jgi:3-deoxy-D-manno-octulosonic acid kinase
VNEAEAPQDRRVAGPSEPLTDWHRAVERLNIETCEAAELAFDQGESAGARQFLWEPLRDFVAAAVHAGPHRLSRAVLAGYWSLARAAKLWEAEMRWREVHLESFEIGRAYGVVRREWGTTLDRVLARQADGEVIVGGRGATMRIPTEQGPVILRRFHRGGAMRWLGEIYFGFRPRPLREFAVLLRARRRGLAVPDPLAAVVERRFGVAYRGCLLMHEIVGGTPLCELAGAEYGGDLAGSLARGLRQLHDAGLSHPDLNLGNVLVVARSYGPRLAFVDLDRARLSARPLGTAARRRSLRRLRRSATKLDPTGRLLSSQALDRLERMYWEQPPQSGSGAEEIGGLPR